MPVSKEFFQAVFSAFVLILHEALKNTCCLDFCTLLCCSIILETIIDTEITGNINGCKIGTTLDSRSVS